MGDQGAFAALASGAQFSRTTNLHAMKVLGGSRKRARPLALSATTGRKSNGLLTLADDDDDDDDDADDDDDGEKGKVVHEGRSKKDKNEEKKETVAQNASDGSGETGVGRKRRTRRGNRSGKKNKGTNGDMAKVGDAQQDSDSKRKNNNNAGEFVDDEQVRAFRRRVGIKLECNGVAPRPYATFDELERVAPRAIAQVLLRNIEASKYKEPTAVQMQAIPAMLHGRDTLACAPTGSGKTAAFLIPIIVRLNTPAHLRGTGSSAVASAVEPSTQKSGPRSLVVAPTRELAAQILREFERLTVGKKFKAVLLRKATAATAGTGSGSGSGSGGDVVDMGKQKQNKSTNTLGSDSEENDEQDEDENGRMDGNRGHHMSVNRKGAVHDLMVATPMRLARMIERGELSLEGLETLVFDEADRLFDMGFLDQVDSIIEAVNTSAVRDKLVRGMFSATMPPQVEALTRSVLVDPVRVLVGTANAGADTIDQRLMFVGQEDGKPLALRQLVQAGELTPPAILFVQSKDRAKALFDELRLDGINVDVMHAERSQTKRDSLIQRFRAGKIWFLIATDLMARGIDFKGVNCVVNYDFPTSAVSYVHRIGRTGRAGRKGQAVTLFTREDLEHLRTIANVMRISGCKVDDWMLTLKKRSQRKRKALERQPPKRRTIGGPRPKDDRAKRKQMYIQNSKNRKRAAMHEDD